MTAFDGYGIKVSVFFDSNGDEINVSVEGDGCCGATVELTPREARLLREDLRVALGVRGEPADLTAEDLIAIDAEMREASERAQQALVDEARRVEREEAPDRALGF